MTGRQDEGAWVCGGKGGGRERAHQHLVGLVELRTDVTPKEVASTTGAQAPAFDILWIRPQQITHGPIVRHFLLSVYRANLQHKHPG